MKVMFFYRPIFPIQLKMNVQMIVAGINNTFVLPATNLDRVLFYFLFYEEMLSDSVLITINDGYKHRFKTHIHTAFQRDGAVQQDGTMAHTSREATVLSRDIFGERIVS